MCGRFAASASVDTYVEVFGIQEIVDEPLPTFNAAPTDLVPAVVERVNKESGEAVRMLVTPRWGLVPSWSKDAKGAARMINARFEGVAEKPAFRQAFASRRCLIPGDGYYEWVETDGPEPQAATPALGRGRRPKQPYFIRPADGGLLVMAGLYEFWKSPAGEWLTTCTIITTTPTDAVAHLHDRMPMILGPQDWTSWLDPHLVDPDAVAQLLRVRQGLDLVAHPVSTRVNKATNDDPGLVADLGEPPVAGARQEAVR